MTVAPDWSDPGYEAVTRLVNEQAGLSFGSGRTRAAEAGVRRAMEAAPAESLPEYIEQLVSDQKMLRDLVVELTVGETYFFRDPGHFEFIRRRVVPEVGARRRPGHVFRAWSAGCSTGEEAYTLAIILKEEGVDAHVLATDVSVRSLEQAHRARYRAWSLRGLDERALARYFMKMPGGGSERRLEEFDLRPEYRERVTFQYHNLALDPYPSLTNGTVGLDLIVCRNVLIYLDKPTIRRVVEGFARCVSDGGWIVPGPSEPPLHEYGPFQPVQTEWGVFYRHRGISRPVAPARSRRRAAPDVAAATVVEAESNGDLGMGIAEARWALSRGEYARVAAWASERPHDPEACAVQVRAMANIDWDGALDACSQAVRRHPLVVELQYLHAVLLWARGREDDALRAVRRVLYLDLSLVAGHMVLAALLRARRDMNGAHRSYGTAYGLCMGMPPNEPLALTDGEEAGRLAQVARAEMSSLEAAATEAT